MKIKSKYYSYAGFLIIGISFFIYIIFFTIIFIKGYTITGDLGKDPTSAVGTFLGGVVAPLFSLASVLLFYSALRFQRKDLKNSQDILIAQKEELEQTKKIQADQNDSLRLQFKILTKQNFETTFFNLLNNGLDIREDILNRGKAPETAMSLLKEIFQEDFKSNDSINFNSWRMYLNNLISSLKHLVTNVNDPSERKFYFDILLGYYDENELGCLLYYSINKPEIIELLKKEGMSTILVPKELIGPRLLRHLKNHQYNPIMT
ncbi:hypothetical protein [Fulvivirga sp.]|uniref:hypothetical protein n=1 Tax=Fulvivirga sp. TaxID=1931237 RepID=UPI0032EF61CD